MTTTVVSLRDRARCKQLRDQGRLVVIDRRTMWGNPFIVGVHGDRETVVARYADFLDGNEVLQHHLPELREKALACWCAPQACHGDVLAAAADGREWIAR